MRTDAEVKSKITELLGIEGEQRAEQIKALDEGDVKALKAKIVEHHFTRGMVSALYWALGYEFKDIVENFVDQSIQTNI